MNNVITLGSLIVLELFFIVKSFSRISHVDYFLNFISNQMCDIIRWETLVKSLEEDGTVYKYLLLT